MFAPPRADRLAPAVLFSLVLSVASGAVASGWEVDATAFVSRVVDGDTLYTARLGVVRLADIDTPEVGAPGARAATNYLTSLVQGRQVYLDVDDLERTDRYGRIVAVAYVRHNVTHLLNVNLALIEAGLARLDDHRNEFDPRIWTLYVSHQEAEESVEAAATLELAGAAVMAIVASFGLLLLRRSFDLSRRGK
jgi:endonuclease YncB( thermonuclease family)